MKTRLQDQKIKGLKLPAMGRTEIKDIVVPGLMLRVTSNGAKSFCLVYKVPGEHPCGPSKTGKARKGKPHRMTLGSYPMLTLADAREQARLLLEQVDKGIDPRPVQATAAREAYANTLAAVAKRFVAQAVWQPLAHGPGWSRSRGATPLISWRALSALSRSTAIKLSTVTASWSGCQQS